MSRSLLYIELSAALTALAFSVASDSRLSLLPVRDSHQFYVWLKLPLIYFHSNRLWFTAFSSQAAPRAQTPSI